MVRVRRSEVMQRWSKLHAFDESLHSSDTYPKRSPEGVALFQTRFYWRASPMQSASAWHHDPLLTPPSTVQDHNIARTPWLKNATFDVVVLVASVVIVPTV